VPLAVKTGEQAKVVQEDVKKLGDNTPAPERV
jgi:hypothetical protein